VLPGQAAHGGCGKAVGLNKKKTTHKTKENDAFFFFAHYARGIAFEVCEIWKWGKKSEIELLISCVDFSSRQKSP
jgi:hypothetical protein